MRRTPFFTLVLLFTGLVAIGAATAQTLPASGTPSVIAPAKAPTDSRIERIHIEDAGSRIDELRVGGETRTITVAPKGGMPAYDIEPATANRSPSTTERGGAAASGGTRTWKILGF